MTFLSCLYQLFIGPLALLFEVIYALAYDLLWNPGLSIVFLSLAMNFLVLPLYRRADELQARERETEQAIRPGVSHIKKTFSGNERFMMLQAYYRENNYKPAYALRGSLPLLLEIPFFIAAYQFLSRLSTLQGVSFWFIRDLGKPDALFAVGGFTVNVLPVLMTAINIVSGVIYTRGFPLKSKLQLYGMALVFLVFLYQSPAGLVFYWTLNNLFSLLKNVFYKLKKPGLVLSVLFSGAGVGLLILILIHPLGTPGRQGAAIGILCALHLPLILYFVKKRLPKKETAPVTKKEKSLFFLSCLFLAVFTGLLIPSAVIRSSPLEFTDPVAYRSPLWHVLFAFLTAAGAFLVWCRVFYSLAGDKGKRIMTRAAVIASVCGTVNYMAFNTDLGNLSATLIFEREPGFAAKDVLINLAVLGAAVAAVLLLLRWKKDLVRILVIAGGVAVTAMSGMNLVQTGGILRRAEGGMAAAKTYEPGFTLSRDGKNVVVIMLDRGIASYVPFLMEEKPILKEQFAGFTYYPNAVSFGANTNFGTPGLYGGYDYVPEEMNARSEMTLEEKQNEALKVMPVLFLENGYRVSVCDPTYAGYQWIPDLRIYDEYPTVRRSITKGRFLADGVSADQTAVLRRNLFCYSILRTAPVFCQPVLYARGSYYNAEMVTGMARALDHQEQDGLSLARGISGQFLEAYTTLQHFDQLTDIAPDGQNCFVMISNDTPHEPMLLQTPDYTPAESVDNRAYDAAHPVRGDGAGGEAILRTESQMAHYHANMAALLALGEWLDYLRAEGIYDNTRIILVSDHGAGLEQFGIFNVDGNELDPAFFGSLFMVKDFDSREFTVDESFHTNADTPCYAARGLIEDAVNPFTGKPLSCAGEGEEVHILASDQWDTLKNNGSTFLPGPWYAVHDDPYRQENWRYLGEK